MRMVVVGRAEEISVVNHLFLKQSGETSIFLVSCHVNAQCIFWAAHPKSHTRQIRATHFNIHPGQFLSLLFLPDLRNERWLLQVVPSFAKRKKVESTEAETVFMLDVPHRNSSSSLSWSLNEALCRGQDLLKFTPVLFFPGMCMRERRGHSQANNQTRAMFSSRPPFVFKIQRK